MTETDAAVSIVIPTHNRLPYLRKCLAALAEQHYPARHMEVVVVADGCSDDTVAALASASYPFSLRVVSQPASGAAAARNRGAQTASGALLLFLDDDVVASPDLIRAHVDLHREGEACVAVGPYLPETTKGRGFFAARLYRFWYDTFEAMADPAHSPTYRDVLSGNLSIPAATFARVGGFNPAFPGCGVEDYEFGARLIRQGVRIRYAPDARAAHLETTSLARSLQRARHEGAADLLFAGLHPELLHTLQLSRAGSPARWLVFRAPALADRAADQALSLLAGLERLSLRPLWDGVYGLLRSYWYWRGVADSVGTESAWRAELAQLERACHDASNAAS